MATCGHCGQKNLIVLPFDPITGESLQRHIPPWRQSGNCKGPETAFSRPLFVSTKPPTPEPLSDNLVPHLRHNEIVHIRPQHKGGTTVSQKPTPQTKSA